MSGVSCKSLGKCVHHGPQNIQTQSASLTCRSRVPLAISKPKGTVALEEADDKNSACSKDSTTTFLSTSTETDNKATEDLSNYPAAESSAPTGKPSPSAAEKQAKYAEILASVKYHPPENAANLADSRYSFEVLKTGTVVEKIKFSKLDNKGFYIVGRVPTCDVVAENPTVSRCHAVIQFVQSKMSHNDKPSNEDCYGTDNPSQTGVYIYDLNSTHGTFINKNQLYPNRFYRLRVGHVIKFGNSARLYVLMGPPEDEEEESDKTVTELQNEKLRRELEKKKLEEQGLLIKTNEDETNQDGCTWGMAEDAEEESDMRENPFAMNFEDSETFDNPKKTLRGWFDREGHELVYDCREKAPGQFICHIDLPVDGPGGQPVFAEVDVKGKKKEAVAQAALQACQILDKYGVLRKSHVESKRKRKERDWADQDYYSSDEDTFLDRTGTIEMKREKRMKSTGNTEVNVETMDTLTQKSNNLKAQIEELRERISEAQNVETGEDVDIDDYMKYLKTGATDVKKMKSKVRELSEELKKVEKLLDIVKPAKISLTHTDSNSTKPLVKDSVVSEISATSQVLNKIQKPTINIKIAANKSESSNDASTIGSLPPSDREVNSRSTKPEIVKITNKGKQPPPTSKLVSKDSYSESDSDDDEINSPSKKRVVVKQKKVITKETKFQYDDSDPKYSTWVPPSNQQGDGRTALNDKLGY